MSRRILLIAALVCAASAVGCKKNAPPGAANGTGGAGPAAVAPGAASSNSDDELMREYIRLRHEFAAALEKKAGQAAIREASDRSSAKLAELHALPQDRQAALQKKFQKEWDAQKERVAKAIAGGN